MSDRHLPADVAAVLADYPQHVREQVLDLRELLLRIAGDDPRIGAVTETLKWGQPAYVTPTGTTVRFAPARSRSDAVGVYTSCQTPLVAEFEEAHGDLFEYDGVRGIHVQCGSGEGMDALGEHLRAAMTYKSRQRG